MLTSVLQAASCATVRGAKRPHAAINVAFRRCTQSFEVIVCEEIAGARFVGPAYLQQLLTARCGYHCWRGDRWRCVCVTLQLQQL